jgi:hypothetical protein
MRGLMSAPVSWKPNPIAAVDARFPLTLRFLTVPHRHASALGGEGVAGLPVRHQENNLGVRLGPGTAAVFKAYRFLNFLPKLSAFSVGLAVPEQDEALTASAAIELCVAVRFLAQHLHGDPRSCRLFFRPFR